VGFRMAAFPRLNIARVSLSSFTKRRIGGVGYDYTMANEPESTLHVDVVSDVVCPWCYIGKRRLESALASLRAVEPRREVVVRWHPFQLNPDVPREGVDRRAYLERKFGDPARIAEIYGRINGVGREVGIPFAFDRIMRQPNTLDAHRLIAWAQDRSDVSLADALVERLFGAYFIDGRFIGDPDELATIAGEAGLDASAARTFLASDDASREVAAEDERAHDLGISGVPLFIFDGRTAVSGAQDPQVLLQAIEKAREAITA
jgi:predicted DsbA family dithiol-disulfide isomerase